MNKNIKLVALDLDRTTLGADGKISETNRAAILAAIKNGIHVCIASGRAFDTLPNDVVSIPGIEYAITSNGAAVYEVEEKKCLRQFLLKPESVDNILEKGLKYEVTFEAFINGTAYASKEYVEDPVKFGATEHAVAYVKSTRHLQDDIVKFTREHRYELDCMDIVVKEEELKNIIMEELRASDEDIYLTSSIKQLLEISYKEAGKKSGVKYLAQKLGIDRENIAAFGDADNDIDMIEYAGCGIAMANASDNLMKVADYVTLHHDKDGVAYAFKEILDIV